MPGREQSIRFNDADTSLYIETATFRIRIWGEYPIYICPHESRSVLVSIIDNYLMVRPLFDRGVSYCTKYKKGTPCFLKLETRVNPRTPLKIEMEC